MEYLGNPVNDPAVLIQKDDGSAVLRILLTGEQLDYQNTLTFLKSYTTAEVTPTILYRTYLNDKTDPIPDLMTAPLLTGGTSISADSFTIPAMIPEEITVKAEPDTIDLDITENKTAAYSVELQKNIDTAEGKTYTFQLVLPKGLSLPAGEIKYENDEITCGETIIGILTIPDVFTNVSMESAENGLLFSFSVPFTGTEGTEEPPADMTPYSLSLTVDVDKLGRAVEGIAGDMTLSVKGAGDPVSNQISINAVSQVPGEGGWTVVGSEYQKVTENIFWADNNDNAHKRPTWSETLGGSDGISPKLYYTLKKVDKDGNVIQTFASEELSQSNLKLVGLTEMPKINITNGVLSVAATNEGLPTKLVEQDGNGNTKEEYYIVDWSLEPPDSIDDYTIQDVEDLSVTGGTINKKGWYFVLLDDFVIKLDVQQGVGRKLTEQEVIDLLKAFSFHWDYDGISDEIPNSDTLENMLEGRLHADYDDATGELTISGLWKYSVNGNPITYYLQETSDTTDGKLSDGELPESIMTGDDALLDGDDWYTIRYDNTGIPNHGDKDSAVYDGGTLRLVRGGNTEYTATKIWQDIYDDSEERPNPTFTLYRYKRTEGIHTASIYNDNGVKVNLVEVLDTPVPPDPGPPPTYHWEIQAVNTAGNLAVLPQYDNQSGAEWIYVVKENISGSYKQVFGTVTWENGEWKENEDDLQEEWGIERTSDNDYLYNGDTLTNLQEGVVSVGATKEWQSATFQSGFQEIVVELTLQSREKGSNDPWSVYSDAQGTRVQYLFDFTEVSLTDSLKNPPMLPQYQGGDTTKELEYRWLETAVYAGIAAEKEDEVKEAIESGSSEIKKYNISYIVNGVDTRSTENPQGCYQITDTTRSYEVAYDFADGDTKIINKVQDKLNYEVIKEWADGTAPKEITMQIFRTPTGQPFDYSKPYLKFTMNGTEGKSEVAITTDSRPADAKDVTVTWGIDGYTAANDLMAAWPAVVEGLPTYDHQGGTYEYILLEKVDGNSVPVYRNEETATAAYRTVVTNGSGGGGFNLLIEKLWMDNSDALHRPETVTFTLYNKHTNEPIMKKNTTNPYTLTLGEHNIWSQVFFVGTGELDIDVNNTSVVGDDKKFGAEDVYVVETALNNSGESYKVKHPTTADVERENCSDEYLYRERAAGEPIFEVTTNHHRYQVLYKEKTAETAGLSVAAAFAVTNRRLGNIDATVEKVWVDGQTNQPPTMPLVNDENLSQQIGAELQKIWDSGRGKKLALVFRLQFAQTPSEDWEITYNGPNKTDTVYIGGETTQIYGGRDAENENVYTDPTSSDQIIIGLNEEGNIVSNNTFHFFGLPKYDGTGTSVAYTVEEVWLDLTDGTPKKVEDMKETYPGLYELWSNYATPVISWEYNNNVGNDHHKLDTQEATVVNKRSKTKTVTWTKEWQDAYTNESDLRPDLYLDIYRVVHVKNEDGIYERRIEYVKSSGDWKKDSDKTWTLSLGNVEAFDDAGFTIYYYAVERTTQPAAKYDYQPGKYSLEDTSLGTRDEPVSAAEILSSRNNTPGDQRYDLLVLGTRADEEDSEESIPWNNTKPADVDNIGTFGEEKDYPKYALVENGTFTNTLAEVYTIEGMKYWTNLPVGWDTENRLPGVQFLVYRYVASDVTGTTTINPSVRQSGASDWLEQKIKNDDGTYATTGNPYYAAQLTIEADEWKDLKVGNGYQYLIQYNGKNTLKKNEDGKLVCTGETGALPLERYNAEGKLYIYEMREVVQWQEGVNASTEDVFTVSKAANGFYFTNNYNPEKGSIEVKKFLYLPKDKDGNLVFPAVTFQLERYYEKTDGMINIDSKNYALDSSFVKQTMTLTSAQVQAIWGGAASLPEEEKIIANGKDSNNEYIWATLQFDNLPLYAPDGTEYRYGISENKTALNDFTTWAKKGDATVPTEIQQYANLQETQSNKFTNPIQGIQPEKTDTPEVDAAFVNKRTEPLQKHNQFQAIKIWEDNDDPSFRPTMEEFKDLLTLKRTANKQSGTGGAAALEETLQLWDDTTGTGDYNMVIVADTTNNSKWIITITPANEKTFDKYAPNGMTWQYTLSENVKNGRLQIDGGNEGSDANKVYTPSTPNNKIDGKWEITITDKTSPMDASAAIKTYSFGSLTNSTLTRAQFQKKWTDSEGKPIQNDYLGFGLTVDFQLQVRPMDSSDQWMDAADWTYDGGTKNLGLTSDTKQLTGRVVGASHNWTGMFSGLPSVVKNSSGQYIFLEYRAIETKVSWGEETNKKEQTINMSTDGAYAVSGTGPVTNATFACVSNTSTSTNRLDTTEVSVTKVWSDTDNQYGTRPGSEAPWSWSSWFVLQRSTNNTDWENVALFQKLYGNNSSDKDAENVQGKWEDTITGLPTMDYTTGQAYIYQAQELQPKDGGYTSLSQVSGNIVAPNGTYNPSGTNYTTTYNEEPDKYWTVTNAMNTPTEEVPKDIMVVKNWVGDDKNGNIQSVTFQLQYTTAPGGNSAWEDADFLSNNQSRKTADASNNWTVSWKELPDSDDTGADITGYQVLEKIGDGWVQLAEPTVTEEGTTYTFTFKNAVTTEYSVEKVWNPVGTTTHSVTMGLYRTTDSGKIGETSGEAVPAEELDANQGVRTVTLDGTVDATEKTAWQATFTNLPKYDENGQPYHYYALEMNGDTPVANHGDIVLDKTYYEVSYDWTTNNTKTTVTNTTSDGLIGSKTWMDDNNAYQTRPSELKLILERKVETDATWTDVSSLYSPVWAQVLIDNPNTWTFAYTGLPNYDANGNQYTYRVREVVPEGYTLQNPKADGEPGEVEKTGDMYHFINVLTEKVQISGQKVWKGGVGTTELTLKLERRLYNRTPEDTWTEVTGATPTWTKPEDSDTWTYTYNDLSKYNENGVLYEYRVREVVPDGYEAGYTSGQVTDTIPSTPVDGLKITNYKDGALTVLKTVSGNRGDQNKDFTFTVQLTGESWAGTAGESITKAFTIVKKAVDGTETTATLSFTAGVSDAFNLKHGESLIISGLPAGIDYRVTETEENQDGYRTSGTGWNGEIPVGGTAEAAFENYNHHSGGGGGEPDHIDITGDKIWVDDGENDENRPKEIQLELYRKIEGGEEERVYADVTWTKNGNVWTYTFSGLPKTDEDGNPYIYRVHEVVPDGYVSSQNGFDIINRSLDTDPGSLQVSKFVTGLLGDSTREFTFTVTLSNKDLTGTYGQMTFVNGVATFTLRDGETILAENLPDGTTYTVTEVEANQDGYSTTFTGDKGTIKADTTAAAVFINDYSDSDIPDPGDDPEYPDPIDIPDTPDALDTPETPTPIVTDTPVYTGNPEGAEVPTGDKGNLILYGSLTILFVTGLLGLLCIGRKNRR